MTCVRSEAMPVGVEKAQWSSRHGPAPLRFFILNPAMDQGQAVASGRPGRFHEEYGVRRLEPVDAVRSADLHHR